LHPSSSKEHDPISKRISLATFLCPGQQRYRTGRPKFPIFSSFLGDFISAPRSHRSAAAFAISFPHLIPWEAKTPFLGSDLWPSSWFARFVPVSERGGGILGSGIEQGSSHERREREFPRDPALGARIPL
jgi:hypothetical protein